MKYALTFVVLALALVAPAQAAPNPDASVDPYTTFMATRILPNQNEIVLATYDWQDGTLATEQVIRATVLGFVRQQRINNPSWRIVIYGPIDLPETWYTNGDRIWDSATDL